MDEAPFADAGLSAFAQHVATEPNPVSDLRTAVIAIGRVILGYHGRWPDEITHPDAMQARLDTLRDALNRLEGN